MTIAEALKKHSKIEADLLLAHALKKSKEFLYMNPGRKLTADQKLIFENMAKKRSNGMPAAYLLGYKYFYGLKFKVNRNVLIPRPETEWLVQEALKVIKKKLKQNPQKKINIIDVGTGSGCIAVSIAKNSDPKKVSVWATDISEQALKVAKANAKINKVQINFSRRNLLQGVKRKFDIIIANLPYVPSSFYKANFKTLKFEPKQALTDGTDEAMIIREFIDQFPKNQAPHSLTLLEIDPSFNKYFTGKKARIVLDFKGMKRFIILTGKYQAAKIS